jgi:hypothetical protein
LADHKDIVRGIENYKSKSRLALQIELVGLDMKSSNGDEDYSGEFSFSIIDTQSGEQMLNQLLKGSSHKSPKDKVDCTGAFFHCYSVALSSFLSGNEFAQTIKNNVPIPK